MSVEIFKPEAEVHSNVNYRMAWLSVCVYVFYVLLC